MGDSPRPPLEELKRKVNHHPFVSEACRWVIDTGQANGSTSRSDLEAVVEAVIGVSVTLLRGDHEMEQGVIHTRELP